MGCLRKAVTGTQVWKRLFLRGVKPGMLFLTTLGGEIRYVVGGSPTEKFKDTYHSSAF